MRSITDVAKIYLIDLNRRHVYALTVVAGLLMLVMPGFVTSFGMDGFIRVTKDLGLSLIGIFAVTAALLLGATAVPHDIEKRTLYPILSRPMRRLDYLVGKFAGIAIWLGLSVLVIGVGLFCGVAQSLHEVDVQILSAAVVSALQAGVIVSFAVFFSTFCGPVIAALLTYFTYFVGGMSELYINFFLQQPSTATFATALRAIKRVLPNFELFDVKNAVVHGEVLHISYVFALALYAAAWSGLVLVLAGRAFERRDL